MKAKFTYKEFTLLVGIAVAMIVILTLWLQPVTSKQDGVSRKLIPAVAKPAAKATVEKIFIAFSDYLK